MRKILIAPLLLLAAACGQEPEMCMTPKEVGTVVRAAEAVELECPTCRFGPFKKEYTTIIVSVGGVGRICRVDTYVAALLPEGSKVNLSHAYRVY